MHLHSLKPFPLPLASANGTKRRTEEALAEPLTTFGLKPIAPATGNPLASANGNETDGQQMIMRVALEGV